MRSHNATRVINALKNMERAFRTAAEAVEEMTDVLEEIKDDVSIEELKEEEKND